MGREAVCDVWCDLSALCVLDSGVCTSVYTSVLVQVFASSSGLL